MAETKNGVDKAFDQFVTNYGAKYPKATECLAKDRAALLAFYDFPAEYWIHIRSSNVIESSFATVRHRTDRTKGCLTRDGMLAMIYKLGCAPSATGDDCAGSKGSRRSSMGEVPRRSRSAKRSA